MRWHALQAVPAGSGSGDSSSSSSDFWLFVCLFVIAAASLDVFAGSPLAASLLLSLAVLPCR